MTVVLVSGAMENAAPQIDALSDATPPRSGGLLIFGASFGGV